MNTQWRDEFLPGWIFTLSTQQIFIKFGTEDQSYKVTNSGPFESCITYTLLQTKQNSLLSSKTVPHTT
jgi:hypothetical protein